MKGRNILFLVSGLIFTFIMTLNFSVFIIYDGFQGIDYSIKPLYALLATLITLPVYWYLFIIMNILDRVFTNLNYKLIFVAAFLGAATCYRLYKDSIRNYEKIIALCKVELSWHYYCVICALMIAITSLIITGMYLYGCKILADFWKPILYNLEKNEKRFILGMAIMAVLFIMVFYFNVSGQWDSLDLIYQTDCTFIYNHYYPVYSFGYDYDWDIGNGGIRHPLMTLYTFPIYIIVWCGSKILFWLPNSMAILYAAVDSILIILMGILVNRLCKNEWSMLLYAVSSPILFYIVFVEKYQLISFYLLMYVYSIVNDNSKDCERFLLISASGTMITSAFLGFLYGKEKQIKKRILEWFEIGLSFFATMIATGRIHYILDFRYLINQNYTMFHSGENSTISDVSGSVFYILWRAVYNQTICPVTNLVASCFVPIAHSIHGQSIYWDGLTYKINLIGVLICALVIFAIAKYWNEKVVRVCGLWFIFSMIHMVAFNAGAAPLFNLYYAWMFVVIVSFIAKDYIKTYMTKMFFYGGICGIILALNCEHMYELYCFLRLYTPL